MHRGDAMMWNRTQYYILKDGPVWIFKSSFGQPSVCNNCKQDSECSLPLNTMEYRRTHFYIPSLFSFYWIYSEYFKLTNQCWLLGDNRSSETGPRRVGWCCDACPSQQGSSSLFQPSHKAPVKAVPNMGQKAQITLRWFLGVPHSYVPENDKSNKTVWSCSLCAIVSAS